MPSLLAVRDPIADAKDTFSSWDKCMAKAYCKWPVIVAIVVGSLIVLSVVLCIARCVCCGAECACCCFKCCAGCCGGGRSRSSHKRMKSDPAPMYPNAYAPPAPAAVPIDTRPLNQQYRSHAAPTFNPASAYKPAPEPERPQFATFETPGKPVKEDALPAMPEWKDARSTHVMEEVVPEKRGDVEMDRLDHNGSVSGTSISGAAAVGAARRSPGRSPVQRSPTQDSYGFPQGYQNESSMSNTPRRSPHNSPGPGAYGGQYGQQQDNYRGVSPVHTPSPVYGAGAGAGYTQNQPYGRRSPNQGYNQQYNRPPQGHSPAPPNSNGYGYRPSDVSQNYGNSAPARSNTPGNAPSGYAPSGSTMFEPPAASYPGQQTYGSSEPSYPGQQTYQAFQPAQPQEPQYSGVTRKPVEGSWKEV